LASVDTTVFAAFAAGFVSFISPCVLPLVPGYLSAVSGVSIVDMEEGEKKTSAILLPAIVFCLSFTARLRGARHGRDRPRPDAARDAELLEKIAAASSSSWASFFIASLFVTRFKARVEAAGAASSARATAAR
jgi:cytochrome c-type biogenesis protein